VQVYESPRFKQHAVHVVTTVGTAISGLEDISAVFPALQDLGSKHARYGVESQHYVIMRQALLDTLALGLGDEFTPEVRAAWEAVFAMVAVAMQSGHHAVTANTAQVQT
jgi:hemoglobin-like flavoprotein